MPEPTAPALERVRDRPEHGVRSIADLALHRDPTRPPTDSSPRPPTLKGKLTRRAHNRPVRVPRGDWEAVITGRKRMYRSYSDSWHSRSLPLIPAGEVFPRPAVIYSRVEQRHSHVDAALAVILSYRQEPLGAISRADLIAEGFIRSADPLEVRTGINRFRRYWKRRYIAWGWRPSDLISVVELRPWTEADYDWTCASLFEQLYGDWRGE
jgi:hypothetical protein